MRAVRRRYQDGTLVLETDCETDEGAVTLVDGMPPRDGEQPDLARIVIGRRGKVRMAMELVIRFDYGSVVPWVRRTERGIRMPSFLGYMLWSSVFLLPLFGLVTWVFFL